MQLLRGLQKENDRLRRELAVAQMERDEWKNKAVEMSHMVTYCSEKLNRGPVLIKNDPPADGPEPEMCRHGDGRPWIPGVD